MAELSRLYEALKLHGNEQSPIKTELERFIRDIVRDELRKAQRPDDWRGTR